MQQRVAQPLLRHFLARGVFLFFPNKESAPTRKRLA